jgi:hypothetical protein
VLQGEVCWQRSASPARCLYPDFSTVTRQRSPFQQNAGGLIADCGTTGTKKKDDWWAKSLPGVCHLETGRSGSDSYRRSIALAAM